MKRLLSCFVLLLVGFFSSGYVTAGEIFTWQDCIREAAKNHPDLIAASEGINQSKASEKITASTLYPQVSANVNGATSKSSSGATSDSYSYGVSGSQLVFDGLKTVTNVKAALEDTKAAREVYRFTSVTVRFRLRTAFVSLLEAQESLLVARDIANIRRGNLVLITLRYQSGQEHRGALLTAEANLSQAKYEMNQAKRALDVAKRELSKEMGREISVLMQVEGELRVSSEEREKPDFVALIKNNPSLQKLMAQKNAAAFGLSSAKRNFIPVLSATAGAGKTGSHWPPQGDEWDLGLGLSVPLFEGGLKLAQVSQARAVLNQTAADERSTRDALVLALERTWNDFQDAIDNVGVQEKLLKATEERSKIAQAQYSLGMISYDNWTIIEDDLVSAKKSFLSAQADALLAEASWIQAKGEVLEYGQ